MTSNAVYMWNPAVSVKHGVHFNLYGKTLMSLGTEKHMPYIHRMMKLEDIGSFGLTEMGHGRYHSKQTTNTLIINIIFI